MAQTCVHQSCGKKFTDEEEDCIYHPGPPVFHEGQKGWKCCKPRVLTFDEFLSIPPCTTGKHSTTDRPPTLEKSKPEPSSTAMPAAPPKPEPSATSSRTPTSMPQPAPTPPVYPDSDCDDPTLSIPDGRTCRRKACGQQYKSGQDRKNEKCVHHPGAPLFHEGSKGYTCCKRRVLEFDEFMKIEGCETKEGHLFVGSGKRKGVGGVQNSNGEEMLETVRSDFYQTPTTVIASFFIKKINKDTAAVVFDSPTELSLDLPTSEVPPKRYKKVVQLFGPIDPGASSYKILGTKLEVTLAKADGRSWPVLRSEDPRTGVIIQVGKAARAT